jgi:hypothetical protein
MIHATAERNQDTANSLPLSSRLAKPSLHTRRSLLQSSSASSDGRLAIQPVQMRAASASSKPAATPTAIHTAAERATSGPGHSLPHQTTIQWSFGRHDLTSVKAHTGPAARSGTQSMNAEAFTRGSHIAFATQPSLYLAAHEAAHVVQQRAGVSLPTGVGQKGDRYEQHADQVAQRVVRGQSSESLLDSYGSAQQSSSGQAQTVQRFESEEHQHLGDVATGGRKYDLANPAAHPGDKFELTHGDIVALTGDVFPSDELFRLAAIPGNRGQMVGTRDEVIWGLKDPKIWEMRAGSTGPGPYTGKNDPRFEKGGIWGDWDFSKDVKDKVLERYQKLAADNASHFAAPKGRDAVGDPVRTPKSAGGNYRSLHEFAVREAYKAGVASSPSAGHAGPIMGPSVDMALAREASAQHFLTDAFSAGHLRTPITLIRDYWGSKYPLFWYNLRHKIALDTAIELTSGTPITNHYAYDSILESVEAMAPTLPAITLGDLLAKVFHDVDNEQGVKIEGGGKVFGDAHLDTATENLAVAAIKAGNRDINKAYTLGTQMGLPVSDVDLFGQVQLQTGGTGGQFVPETLMPKPDASEPPQNWKAADINALWDQKLLGNKGDSVGDAITKTVRTGAIADNLKGLAEKFPEKKLVLHPRKAYLKGFVAKIQHDPKAGVLDIINWAPHDMWTGNAPRDMAADLAKKGAAGDPKDNLTNMTMEARVKLVHGLISDGGAQDQSMLLKVFASITRSERATLYQLIEGHPWTGDFQRHFGSRDDLYKVMDGKNVDRLQNLINGK